MSEPTLPQHLDDGGLMNHMQELYLAWCKENGFLLDPHNAHAFKVGFTKGAHWAFGKVMDNTTSNVESDHPLSYQQQREQWPHMPGIKE